MLFDGNLQLVPLPISLCALWDLRNLLHRVSFCVVDWAFFARLLKRFSIVIGTKYSQVLSEVFMLVFIYQRDSTLQLLSYELCTITFLSTFWIVLATCTPTSICIATVYLFHRIDIAFFTLRG